MKFCLEVGIVERHLVEYTFSQLLGQLYIRVDQKDVKKRVCFINEPITETLTVRITGLLVGRLRRRDLGEGIR